MQDERDVERDVCAECESPIEPEGERVFTLGDGGILCLTCALRRGGVYDDADDRWIRQPRVEDLLRPVER